MSTAVARYHVYFRGGSGASLTNRAQIKLIGASGKTLAWIQFYDPGASCDPDYVDGAVIIMHLPIAMLQSILDFLRNEGSVFINFTDRGLLYSSDEPVGEAEDGGEEEKRVDLYDPRLMERLIASEDLPLAVVRVFFATDRNLTSDPRPNEKFGSSRSELSYGTCDVSIPRDHRMGELESPSIWRLEFREKPTKHIVVLDVSVQTKEEFFFDLATRVRSSAKADAFIFIHGYNVEFQEAAKRTAQMSYDLGFEGAPVFYSWPSRGSISAYTIDEAQIEWAQSNLRGFLDDFLDRSSAENIFLIAHSMGNRALTRAFATLITENPEAKQRFREVILTAPDIDAEVFKRDIASVMTQSGQTVTLYASSKDVALAASKKVHGYPRAGDSGQGLVLVPGIETIDATNVDTSLVGHSYYAEARSVLADIFYLVRNGQRADHRFGLRRVEKENDHYWEFKQ